MQYASWVVLFSFLSSALASKDCDPPVGGCGEDGEDDIPAVHADDGTGGMQEIEVEV